MSLFAAKAGAKKVYAVDASDILDEAEQIIKLNKYDHIISCHKIKIEDLSEAVGPIQVDIIISEWMGYCLLYESMLQSVMFARDQFLKKEGVLLPNKTNMYICGIEDATYRRDKIDFWDRVSGFDFSPLKKAALYEPLIDCAEADQVITTCDCFHSIDIETISLGELTAFKKPFQIEALKDETCHCLLIYFDVIFSKGFQLVYFSTSPEDEYTHWKQTIFYFETPLSKFYFEFLWKSEFLCACFNFFLPKHRTFSERQNRRSDFLCRKQKEPS